MDACATGVGVGVSLSWSGGETDPLAGGAFEFVTQDDAYFLTADGVYFGVADG